MFLKRAYGVGYHLAIEKGSIDDENDMDIMELVTTTTPEANLLTNIGKEMTFQIPLDGFSQLGLLLREIDRLKASGAVSSYGINATTLDEVFQSVALGTDSDSKSENTQFPDSQAELQSCGVYTNDRHEILTHLAALIRKRRISFQRDKKAWCCTTLLPGIFVLIGFLVLTFASPHRELVPLQLDLQAYNTGVDMKSTEPVRNPIPFNNPGTNFKCQPGWCAYPYPVIEVKDTEEKYFFCGAQSYIISMPNCTIDKSQEILKRISKDGTVLVGDDVGNVNEVCTMSQNIFRISCRC